MTQPSKIFDVPAELKPAEERKQLKKELKEADEEIEAWQQEKWRIEERLAELKGKR
jgi:hypothetical protein